MKTTVKIEELVDELIEAGIIWPGDRTTAISSLGVGKTWSTGIKDDKSVWDRAESIADSHGFDAGVDDSASSVDLTIRPR